MGIQVKIVGSRSSVPPCESLFHNISLVDFTLLWQNKSWNWNSSFVSQLLNIIGNAMTEIEKKTGMTDAECEHLDNYYTENTFEAGPNLLKLGVKPGFAHNTLLLNELDKEVAEYLYLKAKEFHKSKVEIINELVREKIAVSA